MQGKVQNESLGSSSRASSRPHTQSPAKNKPSADNRNKPAPNVSHKAPLPSKVFNRPEQVYPAGSAFGGTDQEEEDLFAPPGANRATTGGTGGASLTVLGGI
jgi:hypothetical protein